MESITLYYRQGSSDKMYQASIASRDGGFVVQFAYGRRGTTLQTGTKTSAPVSHEEARRIYDQLVAEKTAKGYTPGEDGTPYQHTEKANQATGILPQLLNTVDEQEARDLIADPAYWMQPKHDGRRLLMQKQGDVITGINKLGLVVALPGPLESEAARCRYDFIIDGEAIGDTLYAFDALSFADDDIRGRRYTERLLHLKNLLDLWSPVNIHLVQTAMDETSKAELFDALKRNNHEGVVFKHVDAPSIAGRPNSGGPQRKFKFHETASFVVGKINAKRSVSLFLYAGKNLQGAGNVTIPANHEIPQKDQIVEVRYLYAFAESGCIYQPVYLGVRDDIAPAECTVAQLKFKPEPQLEPA